MNSNKTIDTKGLCCPKPILRLSKAAKGIEEGQVIQIISDDQAFELDVKAWCKITNNPLLEIRQKDDITTAFIRIQR
jgi:TusA-related sulfurtransferase